MMDPETREYLLSLQRRLDDADARLRSVEAVRTPGSPLPGPLYPIFFARRGSVTGEFLEQYLSSGEWVDAGERGRRCTDSTNTGALKEIDSDMVTVMDVTDMDEFGDRCIRKVVLGGGGLLIPLDLTSTSGSGGSASAAPDFVYTATHSITGAELGTGLSPVWARRVGKFVAATHGVGYYDADGTFVLFQADEVPAVQACEEA